MAEEKKLADFIIKEKNRLAGERAAKLDKLFQDVVDLYLPSGRDFLTDEEAGTSRTNKVFDATGRKSAELLASTLFGAMTSPTSRWFGLSFADERMNQVPSNKDALKKFEDAIYSAINNPVSGFTTAIHEVYLTYVTLGTAGLFVGWSEENDEVFFRAVYLKDIYIEENSEGRVSTVYRCMEMTLRQIVSSFGEDALTDGMRESLEMERFDERYNVIHAVSPNADYLPDELTAGDNLPFSSVYVLEREKEILKKGGFEEEALLVARWGKLPGEVYGYSPAISLLPEVKMLQSMYVEMLTTAQMANRPPLMVPDDAAMVQTVIKPGGIIRYSGAIPVPLQTGADAAKLQAVLQDARSSVAQGFFVDRLNLPDQTMTATEAWIRDNEKRSLLAPMVGRFETEMLSLLIQRVFGLLSRRGRIRTDAVEIPAGVDGGLRIDYLSPMAQAQKRETASMLGTAVQAAGPFLQIDPSSLDALDATLGLKEIFKAYGADEVLRSDDEIEQIREGRKALLSEQERAGQSAQGLQLAQMANEVERGALENESVRTGREDGGGRSR